MKKLLLLFLFPFAGLGAYTEFYVQTTADNLNSGSTLEDSANTSYAGGTFVRATGVFTVASGNPTSDTGVTNGAWASIYTTSGATVATCVGLITNTTTTNLTIDIGTVSGATANVSESAAAATCKVGGAWKGPNGTVGFPFGFIATNSISSATVYPRVNFKSGVTYSITAAITHSVNGPVTFQGYTTTINDGGKATIDGGAAGTSYILLTMTGLHQQMTDMIFSNNGNSGSAASVLSWSGVQGILSRVVVHDAFRSGFSLTGANIVADECEAYLCNKNNTVAHGGFNVNATHPVLIRCISHDNNQANASGFIIGSQVTMIRCIADSNGFDGVGQNAASGVRAINCDFYNNGGAGINLTPATAVSLYAENCNFFLNTVAGITNIAASPRFGAVVNCVFGSGGVANGATIVNAAAIAESGSLTTASLPWVDAPNGDFRLTGSVVKAAGRGAFTETQASYTGTVAYPDIGAAQTASTNAATASGGSWTFAQ